MPSKSRPRSQSSLPDSEKLTINLGFVDLGQIDLLVAEGFYGNRSDFIRTAIRQQLERHAEPVRQASTRKTLTTGVLHFTRADLEKVLASGERLEVRVLGLASFAPDISVDLALATIESITVLGALSASAELKAALATRAK